MASSALEAKINKIKQQNEEIKRRYEEVEEDKKNAAKLNALVQMVPSTDWPERKEPPEFSNPPRSKQKPVKEKQEYLPQVHPMEGKKIHTFAQGEGPPPDPKYNFLADSEREETCPEFSRENVGIRTHNKLTRGNLRKKTTVREGMQKDNRIHKGNRRDEYQPGYDAWRAERNRIDEDRISRQRTAEGNWRREWDNDKTHIVDDATKAASRPLLGDFTKKDPKEFDRRYHANGNEHVSQNRGGNHRPHRGLPKNFHGNYENRSHTTYDQHRHNLPVSGKAPLSPTFEERTVTAIDKSIKVTLNQGNAAKGPLMSVKVNSPSIAGTGRVGPRQRTRVTYSHSDAEMTTPEIEPFTRQKSFDDKSKGAYFGTQKSPNIKRSQSQKKEKVGSKSPYLQRKEIKREENGGNLQRHYDDEYKSYVQKDNQRSQSVSKVSPRPMSGDTTPLKHGTSVGFSYKQEADPEHVEKDDISCSDLDTQKAGNIEDNIEIPSQICESTLPQIEESDVRDSETDIKHNTLPEEKGLVIAEEAILSNATIETPFPVSASVENLQSFAKDNNEKENNMDNQSQSVTEYVNTVTEGVQENSNLSDVVLPLNKVQLQGNPDMNKIQTEANLVTSESQSQEETTLDEAQLSHVTDLQENQVPQMAGLKECQLPEEVTSNEVQSQQMAGSEEVKLPKEVTSNEVQSLHNVSLNELAAPENVPPNKVELREVISSDLESQKELPSSKSNNVSDGIIKLNTSIQYDQQIESPREVSEPSVNDNCDNIKDEICSVIVATTDGSECCEEAARNETVDTKTEMDGKDESTVYCKKNSVDIVSCNEVKTEDIVNLNTASADGYLKDKIESQNTSVAENEERGEIENVEAKKE